jgi:hypothetical protein
MIRRICLLFLLANTSLALAQPLYKWVEADGSITFSPQLPPAGVVYETVNAASPGGAGTQKTDAPVTTAKRAGTQSAQQAQTAAELAQPAVSLPRIEYAPGSQRDLPAAISRSNGPVPAANTLQPITSGVAIGGSRQGVTGGQSTARSTVQGDLQPTESVGISAASYKQSRCQDLRKRVTSLERRLKSRLTPEDMDNTVIHMARYQRSYDQHCSQ